MTKQEIEDRLYELACERNNLKYDLYNIEDEMIDLEGLLMSLERDERES